MRSDNIPQLDPDRSGAGLAVGIVMSRFNTAVAEGLLASCTSTLLKQGVAPEDILIISVPGAFEQSHTQAARCGAAQEHAQTLAGVRAAGTLSVAARSQGPGRDCGRIG